MPPGIYLISDTLTITRRAIEFKGFGWGPVAGKLSTILLWGGTAGSPMIQLMNTQGAYVRRLRLVGNTANQPSAGINFNQQAGFANSFNTVEHVWIGDAAWDTYDNGRQFTAAILFDGINANNSENQFFHVNINDADVGVDITNQQYGNNWFRNLYIRNTDVGVRTRSNVYGDGWNFSVNDVDIQIGTTAGDSPRVSIQNFSSEQSGRLALFSTSGRLNIMGGQWVAFTDKVNADGEFISANYTGRHWVSLNFFELFEEAGYSGPTPTITLKEGASGLSQKALRLIQCEGIGDSNIDIQLAAGPGGRRAFFMQDEDQVVFNVFTGASEQHDFDTFQVEKALEVGHAIRTVAASPAQITSDQNDYDPSSTGFWRISSDATRTITGIGDGADGRQLTLINVGSEPIVLAHQNASSLATNRIITGVASSVTLSGDDTAALIYDNTSQRWRVANIY